VQESLAERRPLAPRSAVAAWWLAFVAAGTFATLWAYDVGVARAAWLRHLTSLLALPLVLTIVRTRRHLLVVVLFFCLGHGLYVLRSLQEYGNGRIDATMGVERMMGAGSAYADPNSFAATIAFSLPLFAWVWVEARSALLRACVLCYGAVGAFCVVRTHSRSGLVLTGLTVLWALWFLPRGRAKVVLLLAVLALGAFAASGLTENAVARYASIFSSRTYEEEESTPGRIEGYAGAAKMLRERPVLGVGPGNWSDYRERHMDGSRLLPHNLPGQVLGTTGLLGGVAFLGYL
jgi:hypothetical protein